MANVPPQPKTSNFRCLWRGSPNFRKMARCPQAFDSEVSLFPQISPAQAFHIFLRENVSSVDWFYSLDSNQAVSLFKPPHSASLRLSVPPAVNTAVSPGDGPTRVAGRLGGQRFSNARGERGRRGGNESDPSEPTQGGASAGKDREGAGRPRPFRR